MDAQAYAGGMSLPTFSPFSLLIITGCLLFPIHAGCSHEPASAPQETAASETNPPRTGYEIPIPMIEFWEGTNQLKYEYEMRYDTNGQVARNGWSRAYYGNGNLEREGAYLDGARSGIWTYYAIDGSINRTEDHGGNPEWTGPDQFKAVPGTEQ